MEPKIEINEKNKTVTITMPLISQVSSTGKMELIASSKGWKKTDYKYKDQSISFNVMAGIKNI